MRSQTRRSRGSMPDTSCPRTSTSVPVCGRAASASGANNEVDAAPPSSAHSRQPRARRASAATHGSGYDVHGTRSSAPSEVLASLGWAGVGVMPPRCRCATPAPSAVRKIEPTLLRLRTLSSSTSRRRRGEVSGGGAPPVVKASSANSVAAPQRGHVAPSGLPASTGKRRAQAGAEQRRAWNRRGGRVSVTGRDATLFAVSYRDDRQALSLQIAELERENEELKGEVAKLKEEAKRERAVEREKRRVGALKACAMCGGSLL